MRIGTFTYSTNRGLSHLARDFARHGIITDTLVVEHPNIPTNTEWYPGAPKTSLRRLNRGLLRDFVQDKDAMLWFETPFDWDIIEYCRLNKVRTYLVCMYECTPVNHKRPHKYLCPSLLDMQYFPAVNSVFLPLPVTDGVVWRLRERAATYIHNGGYLGVRGREGTETLIEAMAYVQSPLKLIIRVQENVSKRHQQMAAQDRRIDYRPQNVPFEELHVEGEVYVAPQKWNGCSLPLQEAFAAGFCVMSTDRFPMNTWLPRGPLIPVKRYIKGSSIGGPYLKFDEAVVDPRAIARVMDEYFGKDVAGYSLLGKQFAEEQSWEQLGPLWKRELES